MWACRSGKAPRSAETARRCRRESADAKGVSVRGSRRAATPRHQTNGHQPNQHQRPRGRFRDRCHHHGVAAHDTTRWGNDTTRRCHHATGIHWGRCARQGQCAATTTPAAPATTAACRRSNDDCGRCARGAARKRKNWATGDVGKSRRSGGAANDRRGRGRGCTTVRLGGCRVGYRRLGRCGCLGGCPAAIAGSGIGHGLGGHAADVAAHGGHQHALA